MIPRLDPAPDEYGVIAVSGQTCKAPHKNPYILLSGIFLSLDKTNLSSLVAHIPKEEETQVLTNIIKC